MFWDCDDIIQFGFSERSPTQCSWPPHCPNSRLPQVGRSLDQEDVTLAEVPPSSQSCGLVHVWGGGWEGPPTATPQCLPAPHRSRSPGRGSKDQAEVLTKNEKEIHGNDLLFGWEQVQVELLAHLTFCTLQTSCGMNNNFVSFENKGRGLLNFNVIKSRLLFWNGFSFGVQFKFF